MMTLQKRPLSFVFIMLVVYTLMSPTAFANPLPENPGAREYFDPSGGEIAVSDQQRFRQVAKRDLDHRLISSTASSTGTETLPVGNLKEGLASEVIVDTEPHCLLHHEYAEILHINDVRLDPEVRFFTNRQNETRYYICLPCRRCPPGVKIIFPCRKKRDRVCSSMCVNPDHVFDPTRQICGGRQTPIETTVNATGTSVVWTSTVRGDFQLGNGININGIEADVNQGTTISPPSDTAPWNQITVITVGVLSLNVLVVVGIVFIARSFKCKRRPRKPAGGCFNNALSTSSCRNLPSNITITPSVEESSNAHEIQRDVIPQGPVQANEELALVPQQTKANNLNVFHEPGYTQGAETSLPVTPTPNEDFNSRTSVQVLRGKDPFWLVMIGQFGPEGGVLSCEDSDVILEIPPGAIPADCRDQLIIARVSLRPDSVGPKRTDPDSLWLTPLVEFESPGLDRFNKDVRIRLPHCALVQPGWTFRVHYTNPTAATRQSDPTHDTVNQDLQAETALLKDTAKSNSAWFDAEQKFSLMSKSGRNSRKASAVTGDVIFSVDEKYINVSTSHFSKYCCSGCHKEHPLHLEAVVYWNHTKVDGREQMDLSVYVLDPIKDSRVMVEMNEPSISKCHTGYYPLILGYKKKSKEASSLEICVQEDSMGDDWKWRLKTYNGCLPAKRVIPIQSLIRCCTPLLSSRHTFSFCPKTPGNESLSLFQAMVCIKQQNWPEMDRVPILVTVPLVKGRTDLLTWKNNVKEDTTITDEQIEVVVKHLPVKKWRPLFRTLMGKGADNGIDHIQAHNPNNTREQIHEAMVSWRRSRGHEATVQELMTALEAVGERAMTESLRPGTDVQDGLATGDEERIIMCKETTI